MTRDTRRINIDAPPTGSKLSPPPRRRPDVVLPTAETGPTVRQPSPQEPTKTPLQPGRGRRDEPLRAQGRVVSGQVSVPAPGTPPPRAKPTPPKPAGPKPTPPRPAPQKAAPSTRPPATRPPAKRNVEPKKVALAVAAVLALFAVTSLVWSYAQFRSIERIDLSDVLASGNGTNYLIVGSDTREGVDPDDPDAAAIIGDNTAAGPQRSDTILILRVTSGGSRMLSIPRDLFVTISETGEQQRINAAFNGGPQRLIRTIQDQLGIPIHHYIQVNFVSFRDLVDAVGGITIFFEHGAIDRGSGLFVPETGDVLLDGTRALAYVRSRNYVEFIDGREVGGGLGDLDRVVRQQMFLSAVFDKVGGTRNPLTLRRIAGALTSGMTIDDDLGYWTAVNLLRRLRGLDPATASLPVDFFRTRAGAEVLLLREQEAADILREFGSPGARIG